MDIWQSVVNFAIVSFMGLLIAFSPMLIVVNLLLVIKSKRPVLNTIILLAGIITPLILVAVIAKTFINPDSQLSLRSMGLNIHVPPLIDMVFGFWLISVAGKRYYDAKASKLPTKTATISPPPQKPLQLYVFAFAKSLLSVTNLFAILMVAKTLTTTNIGKFADFAVFVWVIAIGLSPFFAILYYHNFRPQKLVQLNNTIDRVFARNTYAIINIALVIVGSIFIVSGLLKLR